MERLNLAQSSIEYLFACNLGDRDLRIGHRRIAFLTMAENEASAFPSDIFSAGLILDAVIIVLGSRIGPNVLKAISPVRFITHGVLIPLLFPICGYALDLKKPVIRVLWIVTAPFMVAGAAQAFFTVLEPKEIAGVVRHVSSSDTPKWADMISRALSFGTVIPMMIAGAFVRNRQKTPYLFLSAFLMFVFSALGPATGNTDLIFFISMFGELFMVLFLYLYAERRVRQNY